MSEFSAETRLSGSADPVQIRQDSQLIGAMTLADRRFYRDVGLSEERALKSSTCRDPRLKHGSHTRRLVQMLTPTKPLRDRTLPGWSS
jgi:hypothetical protein